ncbi:MAG: hypothetical protein MPJ50_17005 [Pirellulales bacterium]|nr:hypothetical protein [Pirellulales bacterium]
MAQLSNATDEITVDQALVDLRAAASKAPKTSEAIAKRVVARGDSILAPLIRGIQFLDLSGASSGGNMRRKVASLLHLPDDLSEIDILNGLHGWFVARVLQMWREGQPAVISRVAFDRQLHRLISKFRTYKQFGMPEHLGEIVEEERNKHLGEQYVRQLGFVQVGSEEVFEAIDDYIRCSTERFRLENEGDLSADDWEDFERALTRSWENIFRKEVRLGTDRSEIDMGYKILCDTRATRLRLETLNRTDTWSAERITGSQTVQTKCWDGIHAIATSSEHGTRYEDRFRAGDFEQHRFVHLVPLGMLSPIRRRI